MGFFKLTAQSTEEALTLARMNFPTEPGSADDLSPIAGVSLETYVAISRSFAEVGYDQSRGPELAARQGVGPAEWAEALDGWNARITAFPAVAKRFNALYTGR